MRNTIVWDESIDFFCLIEKLDQSGNGFLVIIDKDNKLLGMVTDGDIRRAILNKTTDFWAVVNKSPITADVSLKRSEIEKKLKENKRRQIPIVDKEGTLVDIFFLNESDHYYESNYVVIMAGGLGTRLGELTKDIPKPMLPVGGKPMIENILVSFRESGFNNFIICVNYRADVIKDYLGDGSRFNVKIQYVQEENKMGTAGALSLIDKKTLNEPFFVVNGDILASINYQDLLLSHRNNKADGTMCVKRYEQQIPYACISCNEAADILDFSEKPVYEYKINAGVYVLKPSVLNLIPHGIFFDMTSLFAEMLKEKMVVKAYQLSDYWLDIGQKSDYVKANADFKI